MASTLACWRSFTIAIEGSFVDGAGCVVDVEAGAGEGEAGAGESDARDGEGEAGAGAGESDARDGEGEDRARLVAFLDEEATGAEDGTAEDLMVRTSRAISRHVRSSVLLDSPPILAKVTQCRLSAAEKLDHTFFNCSRTSCSLCTHCSNVV
jgi:hypothetical protein